MEKILPLGSGELGKEFVISTKRWGCHVMAVALAQGADALQRAREAAGKIRVVV